MSAADDTTVATTRPPGSAPFRRLTPWLQPRDTEERGRGDLRLVESAVIVLVAVLLAVATINDVVRQTHINQRLVADLDTWRAYTGHAYHNLNISQKLLGENSGREVVCGNTVPGGPRERVQLCLAIWGPVHAGRRTVHGGWYLPPRSEGGRRDRYACFGSAVAERICSR
jgi:hypothetical protein